MVKVVTPQPRPTLADCRSLQHRILAHPTPSFRHLRQQAEDSLAQHRALLDQHGDSSVYQPSHPNTPQHGVWMSDLSAALDSFVQLLRAIEVAGQDG